MANLEDTSVTIGGLLARMDRVEEDTMEIKIAQKEILRILHNAEGSWKTLVAIGAAGVAIGAAIAGVIAFVANIRQAFGK